MHELQRADGRREENDGVRTPGERDDLDVGEICHVLQNRRRRRVLDLLREGDGSATLSELAENIAAEEHDTTVDALRSDERKRVYIALYQGHLPKMDDAGVLDFDADRGTVVLLPLAERLSAALDALRGCGDGAGGPGATG